MVCSGNLEVEIDRMILSLTRNSQFQLGTIFLALATTKLLFKELIRDYAVSAKKKKSN